MARRRTSDYVAFVEPGNVITRRVGARRAAGRRTRQRAAAPAADAGLPPGAPDRSGITMVNIGVGPANAKTITDHIAVLRPHAWLMLGHCAGLRNTQQLGDYVLAHGYVREDHVLDEELPLWVPIPPLAEIQLALGAGGGRRHAAQGLRAEARHAHRHGGAHRQPQLGAAAAPGPGAPLQPEPRDRARHGKRHHRRQRLSLPRALRHLAVRERQAAARRDQAARHGQPVLPRARRPAPAHRHARDRVAAPQASDQLHSRKLRSFAEVAFQ